MNKGQIVEYVGRGFLGFDKKNTTMEYVKDVSLRDVEVLYNGYTMIVSKFDIK